MPRRRPLDRCAQQRNRTFIRPSKPLLVRLLIAVLPRPFYRKRDSNPRLSLHYGRVLPLHHSRDFRKEKYHFHRTTPDGLLTFQGRRLSVVRRQIFLDLRCCVWRDGNYIISIILVTYTKQVWQFGAGCENRTRVINLEG